MTSDVLFNLWKTAEFNYTSPDEKHNQVDVYNSIAWYVETGRSCYAWEKALKIADPKKLLKYILKQDDQSVTGQITSTTAYLKRYCKYPY